jgi:hypothetical protein
MKKLILLLLFVPVIISGCSNLNQKACLPAKLTELEQSSYNYFKDHLPRSQASNVEFELFTIAAGIAGNTTRQVYTCPATIKDQQGGKEQISDGTKTYQVVYEKLNDYEYKLGFKDGERTFYYYGQ